MRRRRRPRERVRRRARGDLRRAHARLPGGPARVLEAAVRRRRPDCGDGRRGCRSRGGDCDRAGHSSGHRLRCGEGVPVAARRDSIVNPSSAEAARDVERQVRDLGVRAIKIHPRLQRISYGDLDTLVPVARACGRARVPLVICSFIGGPDLFKARTLEWCLDLAVAAPETAVILAHAGGYRPLDALLMLKAQPNIHLDLSFSPLYFAGSSVVQDFGYLVRKADPARVLFGSDFPEVSMAASVEWLRGAVQTAGLSASDRDLMFGGNAERLFGRAA